jgi:hypothetical protein
MGMVVALRGRASARKLRLFACACLRRAWGRLTDKGARRAVEVAEQFADGHLTPQALAEARERFGGPFTLTGFEMIDLPDATSENAFGAACGAAGRAQMALTDLDTLRVNTDEQAAQSDLLRDIFGNPFRPRRALDPAILAWHDGTVRRLAQAAYDERHLPAGTLDAGRLGILADALTDAGCDDEDLIAHCRSPGPHVRGCWAVDLILGKA